MFKSNIEYQECYVIPAHLYSRFLEFLDEETQMDVKTLNKRINPNIDFFTKTLKDIEPYTKKRKKNNRKKNNDESKEKTETIINGSIDTDTDENEGDISTKNVTSVSNSNLMLGTPTAASTPSSNVKNNPSNTTTTNNNNSAISTKKKENSVLNKANEISKNKLHRQRKIPITRSLNIKSNQPYDRSPQKRKFTEEKNKDNEDEKKKKLSGNSSVSAPSSTLKSAKLVSKGPSRNVKKPDEFKYGKGRFGFKEYYFPL